MTRRRALFVAGLIALVGAAGAVAYLELRDGDREPEGQGPYGPTKPAKAPPADKRPNLVLIMTDDQENETMRYMPKTRALLGREGVEFDNAHTSFPLCCPSRATILTGQYAHNHGVRGNSAPSGGWEAFNRDGEEARALPVALQRAGYNTLFVGRYLNGWGIGRESPVQKPQPVPPGWTDFAGLVGLSAYRMWGFTLDDNGHSKRYPNDPADANAYQTDVLDRLALGQIREHATSPRPFMLNVWVTAPHTEENEDVKRGRVRPAPRDRNAYAQEPLYKTPAFNEADNSDKPPYISERDRLDPRTVKRLQNQNRLRIRSLQSVDDLVGNVTRALEQTGRLDNTVIAFTSDNGFIQGQHRIFNGKIVPYSSSTQVPLLVRGPGFERGARSDALVANVDLAPTFLELAGAKPLVEPDGFSLVPLLEGKRLPPRDLVLEYLESNAPGEEEGGGSYAPYRGLRTERWLYVDYDDPHQGVELYDLQNDPDNLENLASDTRYIKVRERLNRRLQALKDCAGDACRGGRPAF